jgi:hypothetical protein
MYDPSGRVADEVTVSDVVVSSVRTGPDGGRTNTDFIYFALTPRGRQRFHHLTAGLAHRGSTLHRVQHFAFEVEGRIYARPFIDYRINPDGLDASTGLEIPGVPPMAAKRVAAALRGNDA